MTLLVGSIFHMTRKIVSEMTYNVSMGTLNPTIPIPILPQIFWPPNQRSLAMCLSDQYIHSTSVLLLLELELELEH